MDINEMTDAQYKVYENKLRRAARRQGLQLIKSRSRDPRAIDYCQYMIADERNCVVAGAGTGRPSMSLDDVAEYLK